MLTRLNHTIETVDADIERYRLNEALTKIYTLFWGDYCDWYLELIKPRRSNEEEGSETMDEDTLALAVELYETMVQLLHPFMPFITEALWHRLRPRAEGEACIISAWPSANAAEADDRAAATFSLMQEMISNIRNVKSRYGVAPGKEIAAIVNLPREADGLAEALTTHQRYFARLARVADLTVGSGQEKPAGARETNC